MGKAKLARPCKCFQIVLLAPTRSFNTTNAYTITKIKKRSFLVGQKFCLIWRLLEGQREYVFRVYKSIVKFKDFLLNLPGKEIGKIIVPHRIVLSSFLTPCPRAEQDNNDEPLSASLQKCSETFFT